MNNTLKRLDTFVDAIDFSSGIANPALASALSNIDNVVRNSPEVVSFAQGFADHVTNSDTIQTSVIFKDAKPDDKQSIIATVIDLLVSFALFYIGKKKVRKGGPISNLAVDVFAGGRGKRDFDIIPSFSEREKDDTDQLVDNLSSIVSEKRFDAFDDAITGLQYQIMNFIKI